jgi:hypothetical protein
MTEPDVADPAPMDRRDAKQPPDNDPSSANAEVADIARWRVRGPFVHSVPWQRHPQERKTDARRHGPSNRDIKRISVALAENFIVNRCGSVMQIREATEAVSAHRATTSGPRRVFPLDHNTLGRVSLAEGAVATSQPSGTVFEPTGRHQHLFDPRALPVLQLSYHQSGITIKLFENTELTCHGMGNSGPAARLALVPDLTVYAVARASTCCASRPSRCIAACTSGRAETRAT